VCSSDLEEKVLQESISYMDAVIGYCNDIDIDVESVTKLINQSLKDKIQNEAEDQNYMRPRGKLPL
jgi:hypothetical protein